LYDKKYALHKNLLMRPRMAFYGPPTYCGAGHFWLAWNFQMRRPDVSYFIALYCIQVFI